LVNQINQSFFFPNKSVSERKLINCFILNLTKFCHREIQLIEHLLQLIEVLIDLNQFALKRRGTWFSKKEFIPSKFCETF